MFGSDYANHLEILMQSLHEMNALYQKKFQSTPRVVSALRSLYIRIFGIPEVGFQVRGMYFRKAFGEIKDFYPKNILDVGSGIGCYVYYLAKRFPQAQVVGWDVDKYKITSTKKLINDFGAINVDFIYRDITGGKIEKNHYDLIITIDVLEHIENYKKALKNIYTLLKPHGYLYIHVPQEKQIRFFQQFKSWKHEDHVRVGFDPKSLTEELSTLGFKIISVDYTFGFFGSFAWELNHFFLSQGQLLSAITYPCIYLISLLDLLVNNKKGLGMAILVQKIKL